ncbi:MAG: arginine-tRNA-protein transferase, partial [bacterium]
MSYINEYFFCEQVNPELMDLLLAKGWRHFGSYFFRYETSVINKYSVTPLRIDLAKFQYSQSQKRLLRKNNDLTVIMRDAFIDQEKEDL